MPKPPKSVVLVYVARHGATDLNLADCFRGTANPPLAPEGIHAAYELSEYFEPIDLSAIIYSDKRRSEETALIIGDKKPHVNKFPTQSLWAWNVGMFSGQPKNAENKAKLEYYINNPDVTIPQGESLNQFKARIRPCLKDAMDYANRLGKPVLCIAHSSVVHEVGEMLMGDDEAVLVEPGGMVKIYVEHEFVKAKAVLRASNKKRTRVDTFT